MSPAPLGRRVTGEYLMKLKAMTRILKEACGGQETAAMVSRVSHQTISRYCTVVDDGIEADANFIPVDVAMDLMKFSGDRSLLRAMADELGFVLVPKVESAHAGNVVSLVGQFSRGAGALTDEALQAAMDGRIDDDERARILDHVKNEMERLATLGRTVERAG